MNIEKFKGNFDILINPNLPKAIKIHSLVNDPVAFYLHKHRHFFDKIE